MKSISSVRRTHNMAARNVFLSKMNFDLLSLPFQGQGITRDGATFVVGRPWAIADFGNQELGSGWWRLVCQSADAVAGVEVQLRSAHDPLIVLRAGDTGGQRIFLQANRSYQISLIVSPWPRQMVFDSLRLVRLSAREVAGLTVGSVGRLMRNPKRLEVIDRVLGRIFTGHAVGISAGVRVERKKPSVFHNTPRIAPAREVVVVHDGFKAVIAEGDTLHPDALAIVAAEFGRLPEVEAIYSDSLEAGQILPRTQWDDVLAKWTDVAGLPIFFRDTSVDVSRGASPALKAIAEKTGAIHRVPLPLVSRHQPSRPPVVRPSTPVLAKKPMVSIIVPTKNRTDLLAKCLQGLIEVTDYSNLELVIVDNGSNQRQLWELLNKMREKLSIREIKWPYEFNFSEIIAAGVRESTGEIVLMLNDDVEPLQPGWLDRIVESAMEPDVGAVGARLVYLDHSIQHAGVIMGLAGACGHLWKGMPEAEAERNPYIVYPGERLAVTGACLAVRRELFDLVGGLDVENFPVSYNDIDFCLRLRMAGYRTIYRGDAVLIHHESQSRGLDHADPARRRRLVLETRRFLERWGSMISDDPFGSPAFDPTTESGAIHPALREL